MGINAADATEQLLKAESIQRDFPVRFNLYI